MKGRFFSLTYINLLRLLTFCCSSFIYVYVYFIVIIATYLYLGMICAEEEKEVDARKAQRVIFTKKKQINKNKK